ncbi:MAG: iron chelate uptake ABC transporter family permease subunit, partial [Micromonosporaceae bacterium]
MIGTLLRRPPIVAGGAGLLLALVALVHLGLGAADVGTLDVLRYLAGEARQEVAGVVVGSRLPRTLAGLVAGAALGVAGALIQGATRNPLAAPDTLGVNAGAYLGVVAAAYLGLDLGLLPSGAAAFAGGLLAAGLVYLLTAGGLLTPGRVLLAGAAVALAGMASAEFLQILDEHRTRGLFFWGAGSLLQVGLERPGTLGVVVAVAAPLGLLLARPLDLMALGDETAESLGVPVARVRPAALLLAVLLTAAAVTVAGPIGFVGLVAPLCARGLGIRRHAGSLPLAGLFGATLVLAADASAQLLQPPSAGYSELPVGVLTALLGGPVFVLLARRITTGDADVGAAVTTTRRRSLPGVALLLGGGLAVLSLAVLAGLKVGDVEVAWGALAPALFGGGDPLAVEMVGYRLPRILVAAAAGAALAAAGVAVQAVVRNPLAEPGLIGVTGGASVAAVLVIITMPSAPAELLPLSASLGGAVALLLVVLLASGGWRGAGRWSLDPTRVVLVGLGVAASCSALVTLLVARAQMNISGALTWLAGSTYARDYAALGWFVVPALVAVGLVVAYRPVDLLALGEELPRALGLALGRARLLVLAAGAAAAAGSVAAVGAVGFVG